MGFPRRWTPHRLLLSAAVAVLATPFSLPGQTGLPRGPGSDLAYAKCQGCHGLEVVIQSAGIARPMWLGVMEEMKEFGMKVTPDEHEALVAYLATYLGPDPPPENKPTAAPSSALDGAKLFDRHCGACHGQDGTGVSEQIPPLAGNPYLFNDRSYIVVVLLYGLQGPIAIRGRTYEGVMPGFAHLADSEITAIANYTLSAWGNRALLPPEFHPLSPNLVKRTRAKTLTAGNVWNQRERLN